MKLKNWSLIIIFLICMACNSPKSQEDLKQEIAQAEKAFNDYAKQNGVKEAFLAFAHEDAVINRRDSIIAGKEGIRNYFENQTLQNVKLSWKPDFIDVSSGGDMAYTYGKYTFSALTSDSAIVEASGLFHTVWKRDANGNWKYVYD